MTQRKATGNKEAEHQRPTAQLQYSPHKHSAFYTSGAYSGISVATVIEN
jgi:hypothetical protein